ncbi:cell wall-binding repeat-containing protein [Catenulispora subtropica]|uniref:Cell wall binding repeat 2-containing protein n=1 Tax=Catenulispora subtropica TaxID=450798 RepID=A0ABP5EBF7_9ACTN
MPTVGVTGTATFLNVYARDGEDRWDITLSAPTGSQLTAGTTYKNMGRTSTASSAGLDMAYNSSGCTTSFADLTVYQIETDATGAVTKLEAGFDQHCDTASSPAVEALIRFNATGALPGGAPTGLPPTAPQGTTGPLAFVRDGHMIMDTDGGTGGADLGPSTATPTPGYTVPVGGAAWSPSVNRIVYTRDSRLHSYLPDGSGDIAITASGPTVYSPDTDPAVAPDGTVAFSRGVTIMLASLDGSFAGREYTLYSSNEFYATHPTWAADGSLLFQRQAIPNASVPGPTPQPDVYRIAGGKTTLFMANAGQPSVSPDGSRIAFIRADSRGVKQVFTVAADGVSGLSQITHDDSDSTEPAWSPDGRTLAYVMPNWHEVVEVPAVGGAPVGSIPNADAPAWRPAPRPSHVTRIAGADRIHTAIAASQHDFADHGAADPARDHADAVVLARSDTYADALGGSSLAVRKNAPLLITDPTALAPDVARELQRVLAPGGTVYLLGGTSALSPAVASAVQKLHYTVLRLAGPDRYATSVAIAKTVDPNPKVMLIASGDNFPDALAAGATGQPLVLTAGSSMPSATAAYLNTVFPIDQRMGIGNTQIVTVGGPGDKAVIDAYMAGKLHWGEEFTRIKLVGNTRQDTALLVARSFFGGMSQAAFATSASWPDALSGGAMIGHVGGPLLLTDPSGLYGPDADYAHELAATGGLTTVDVLGGPAALPPMISQQIAAQLEVAGRVIVNQAHHDPIPLGTHAASDAVTTTR